ncbi:hypothetical protein TanjilG_24387 [Lupinus angustifolius]|uniref:Syringolide-induced protein 14-1-1 n=1 Tax=Lupinus angustifolius TaxID=3871 RepID=A0A1J7FMQ5_LUPAN|nr:PREDICTED: uncharacterized protein At1g76070-like [Lupinus angustifolius]OIV89237.1 hypothetical protein TanjilG_24387 [Lupinus angustifolius]
MENKQPKLKNNILLKIIPEAAAAMSATFHNSPFTPDRDHKLRSVHNKTKCYKGTKGFSGAMIPQEARRRRNNDDDVETHEPISPKISCIGQIKQKKTHTEKVKTKTTSLSTSHINIEMCEVDSDDCEIDTEVIKKKHHLKNKFQTMFCHAAKPKTGSRKKLSSNLPVVGKGFNYSNDDTVSNIAPSTGDMKRFGSGRETFTNFDWRSQIVPEEMDQRDCLTDVKEENDDDDVINPEPVLVRGGSGRYNDLSLQPRD